MSNKLDDLKRKIKSGSVHSQLIEPLKAVEPSVNVNVDVNTNTNVNDLNKDGYKKPPERVKKQKFEDRYKRDTFWIRNELKEQLDAHCAGEKGEKTRIINEALEMYFSQRV